MHSLHATASPTALLAPMPGALPQGASSEGSGAPSAFARMLQDNQPPAAPPQARRNEDPAPPRPAERSAERTAEHSAERQAERDAGRTAQASGEHAAEHAAEAHAAGKTAAAQTTAQGTARQTAARDAARSRDDARRANAPRPTEQHGEGAAQAAKAKAEATDTKDDAAGAADPALADWLAGLRLPDPMQPAAPAPSPTATSADAATASTADAAAMPGASSPADANGTTPQPAAALATATDPSAANTLAAAQTATLAIGAPNLAATAGPAGTRAAPAQTESDRHTELAQRASDAPGAAGALALATAQNRPDAAGAAGGMASATVRADTPLASTPLASSASSTPAPGGLPITNFAQEIARHLPEPQGVNVHVPVDSPEFPRALGIELAVLARNGIERAELHLSPAELGPVSVQIAIDGTQARIDFGADVASTRQAIEAGLPELASALRDAGLTLTGGGVSQHSRSRQEGAESQAAGQRAGRGGANGSDLNGTDASAAAPSRRIVRAGGIDLFA